MTATRAVLFASILLFEVNWILALIRFTNIQCDDLGGKFVVFSNCRIRPYNRKRAAIFIAYKWLITTSNVSIRSQTMKKANGWRPFLYKIQLDSCDYFRNRKRYPIANALYSYIWNYTNVNHTCPYRIGEENKIEGFELNDIDFLKRFPIDIGEYGVFTNWYTGDEIVMKINIMLSYTDYRNKF